LARQNAGAEGAIVVEVLSASKDPNYDFTAATGKYEDLVKADVIDPAKVTRTASLNGALEFVHLFDLCWTV